MRSKIEHNIDDEWLQAIWLGLYWYWGIVEWRVGQTWPPCSRLSTQLHLISQLLTLLLLILVSRVKYLVRELSYQVIFQHLGEMFYKPIHQRKTCLNLSVVEAACSWRCWRTLAIKTTSEDTLFDFSPLWFFVSYSTLAKVKKALIKKTLQPYSTSSLRSHGRSRHGWSQPTAKRHNRGTTTK